MTEPKKVPTLRCRWSLEELKALPEEDIPEKLGGYRPLKSKKETRLEFRDRVVERIEAGLVNLKPLQVKSSGSKTADYMELICPVGREYVSERNGLDWEDRNALEEARKSPQIDLLIWEGPRARGRTERRAALLRNLRENGDPVLAKDLAAYTTPSSPLYAPDDGLDLLKTRANSWVNANLSLREEEARCSLECRTCPSGHFLACMTDNITTLLMEGEEVLVQGIIPNKEDYADVLNRLVTETPTYEPFIPPSYTARLEQE